MARFDTLRLEQDGGVATLTLNRPESRNALNRQMAGELADALAALREDPEVRVLLLTGAGEAFCAGGDVKDMAASGNRSAEAALVGMQRFHRLTRELHGFEKPVIAAVDGVAYGAGFSIALLADLVIASDRARFCMVFQRIGLVPDCAAMHTLPRVVGLQRAKELVFSARELSAAEARDWGLVLELQPSQQLLPRAQQLAQALCQGAPAAQALAKRALNASLHTDFEGLLALEASAQAVAIAGPYLGEAAARFVAKQPPALRWPRRED